MKNASGSSASPLTGEHSGGSAPASETLPTLHPDPGLLDILLWILLTVALTTFVVFDAGAKAIN